MLGSSLAGNPRARLAADSPSDRLRFDWLVSGGVFWMVGGLMIDMWAHVHTPRLETFFTPYHAVFYSGFAALAIIVLGATWRAHSAGATWQDAIPTGYQGAVAGIMLFAVGGFADMLWHTFFGVEKAIQILLSPTHLILGLAMVVIALGPAQAALARRDAVTLERQLPALISLALALTLLEVYVQWILDPTGLRRLAPTLRFPGLEGGLLANFQHFQISDSILGVIVRSGLLAGFMLFVAVRFVPRLGAVTIVFGLSSVLIGLARFGTSPFSLVLVVAPALVAGLLADELLIKLHPAQPLRLHLIAFAVPFSFWVVYTCAILLFGGGFWWERHMIVGIAFFGGFTGLLLSALIPPSPPAPNETTTAPT